MIFVKVIHLQRGSFVYKDYMVTLIFREAQFVNAHLVALTLTPEPRHRSIATSKLPFIILAPGTENNI
jgi:hypothetical protein